MIWLQMDLMGILSLKRGGLLSKSLRKAALDHLAESVEDPAVREKLTPTYAAGCKRRVISDDDVVNFTLWPYSATRFLFEQNRVVPADFKTS